MRDSRRASLKWLEKYKLTIGMYLVEFVNAVVITNDIGLNSKCISVYEYWTCWTNTKAILIEVGGDKNSLYPSFLPFTTQELKQHISLYILNGISPYLSLAMKFVNSKIDPVNGSDLVSNTIKNVAERHKHFKCFFTIYNLQVNLLPKTEQPNFKVDIFNAHANKVLLKALASRA